MEKYICIHGHFYQPPRENAWLEVIELQDSAYPFHDWNERISSECYAPNTASRILDDQGVIKKITNNYSKISFNFGATLLSWMQENDPLTYEAIIEADRLSMENFSGHGSALAQVYNHIIMPLANRRDKETQVIWGIRDFESRFNRKPEGMWLAETAVDLETLEVLAENDIKFTVLAPRQAWRVRKLGGESEWKEVGERIDTRVPYVCNLPSGKKIHLFFYHGDLSQSVAFNGLLNNGMEFANKLYTGFGTDREKQLVHIATDGESYGHHHKHGDMALAFCLEYIQKDKHVTLTNYGEVLEKFVVSHEVEIRNNSSWSCVHGIERWRANCGCHTGGRPDWNQDWRKPLRESLDWLRDEVIAVFEEKASKLFKDPWDARNAYIDVILDRNGSQQKFLEEQGISAKNQNSALRLMEMQRNALLMYTSCGWFFDEISGIETTQIMQYACRAIQLAEQESKKSFEEQFISRLSKAKSNLPQYRNGAEIYKDIVIPTRLTLERVGIHYAVASIFEEDPESLPVFNYIAQSDYLERREAGTQRLALGNTRVKSRVTLSERQFSFAVLYLGQQNIIGNISIDMSAEVFKEMSEKLLAAFEESNLGLMISLTMKYFGAEKYNLWYLFKDEKRKVLNMIMDRSLSQVETSFRRIYNRDYQLINSLKNDNIPIPSAYRTTLQYVLNADLRNALLDKQIDLEELGRIADEFEKWDLTLDDSLYIEQHASEMIEKALLRIQKSPDDINRLIRLNTFFDYLEKFKLKPGIYKSQNLYFELSINKELMSGTTADWKQEFVRLGEKLGIKVS
ncbi:DUF3536 domain-containing protein [Fulvivirga sedimenti]|uniref:DUF3536 domain-containing protein n=1 Tax=Fulvivirga sedimenti TaxID=2879465 RepID=A0A9X1KZS2_9BACT|nr:DUF3536 domain-containing protein [Fulvivirga sedimenti]MCA6079158.1 DUF3536 domain-containing protein [Fulvivirga sedimenti]